MFGQGHVSVYALACARFDLLLLRLRAFLLMSGLTSILDFGQELAQLFDIAISPEVHFASPSLNALWLRHLFCFDVLAESCACNA